MKISVELNISDWAALQQIIDIAVQKEGLKVAVEAIRINEAIAASIKEARSKK